MPMHIEHHMPVNKLEEISDLYYLSETRLHLTEMGYLDHFQFEVSGLRKPIELLFSIGDKVTQYQKYHLCS